ncbi:MAG: neutral/alkaline non-lysosomal ceramidase N-terminal domain-containing protein [Chloroflexi bacterium]|nr:neutral/alkaline non-lysosomal ceramidase N-terminal domain-containing protein [Chloroflexota bacterium]
MTITVKFPFTRCCFGVTVRDVTPPVGIYARSWGAATHDAADGIHRPFTATAAIMAPFVGDAPVLALVALDVGWFQNLADERALRGEVMRATGLPEDALLINFSHTHAGANVNSQLSGVDGAELIAPYLARLAGEVAAAVNAAKQALVPAWIAYGTGRCALAKNRDYWDAEKGAYACGFNPDAEADDTLIVARVTDEGGHVLATLFNYACHPTTLAWQNRLLSPDFIGAAREVLENAFGAPALFLQGASGELAPRDNYVGAAQTADRNGRQLGYAAAAAIEGLPPAGTRFVYTGMVSSGANLGTWSYAARTAEENAGASVLSAHMRAVELERKPLPTIAELEARLAQSSDRPEQERIRRRIFIQRTLGEHGKTHAMPFWVWRLGEAVLVAVANELYSTFQIELRRRFPGVPVIVACITNGTLGYLAPAAMYGTGVYQEQQSPYNPGCLEQAIKAVGDVVEELAV